MGVPWGDNIPTENLGWVLGVLTLATLVVYLYATMYPSSLSIMERNVKELDVAKLSLIKHAIDSGGTVTVNLNDESITVEDDGNWLEIYLMFEDGTKAIIYNDTFGRITIDGLVYECGGVFEEDRVIIPPELHYKGSTLSLSIVKITNDFSISGRTKISLKVNKSLHKVFPDSLKNPVNGSFNFELRSDCYKAWAKFLEYEGIDVTVDDVNRTVKFTLPPDLSGIPISLKMFEGGLSAGLSGNISSFIMHLMGLHQDLDLPIVIDANRYELVIQLKKTGGGSNESYLVIAFIDKVEGFYETWRSEDPIPWKDSSLDLNILDDSITMVYTDQLGGVVVYDLEGEFADPSITWGGDVVKGTRKSLNEVFSHYISLFSNSRIIIKKPTDVKYKGCDMDNSWIYIEGEFVNCIKFLYIAEHRVRIEW
ncbi:hypothetical protein [Archaeoglobus profundus]|uniref:Uncharacterized protein n=1 Tax=Archaeoglobus profundus (strain DSM 5631 / JCM 9629 / NBRC 100127 / Av18) TaxID=572546 RepID=D2RHK8_ARCPA|nr:hypothetical protein [Archaeoglobus profundus]ADB57783.1 hypothetical protein Arcpr_0719 [Archaeoglobus profundus DSM 5631]